MRKLSVSLVSALATIILAATLNVNASAKRVTVIRRVTAKEVKVASVAVNDRLIGQKGLKPGRKITISETASWGWAVSGRGFHNTTSHFWVVIRPDDTSWFK